MKRSADETIENTKRTKVSTSNEQLKYKWTEVKNNLACMYVYSCVEKVEPGHFTYMFDMDGTITKYDKKKPLADPEFLYPEVKTKLESLVENGDSIVVLSNQAGVAQGHSTIQEVQKKIEKLVKLFSFPVIVCIAPYNDYYRKPCWGM